MSIGRLEAGGSCTATVVNSTWAVSATHCFQPETPRGSGVRRRVEPWEVRLQLSPAPDGSLLDPGHVTVGVLEIYDSDRIIQRARQLGTLPDNFTTDLALLRLDADPTRLLPTLQPLGFIDAPLPETSNEPNFAAAAVGYGRLLPEPPSAAEEGGKENDGLGEEIPEADRIFDFTDAANSRGLRYWTRLAVSQLQRNYLVTDGGGKTGPCGGDSGGPLLLDQASGGSLVGKSLGVGGGPKIAGTLWGSFIRNDACVNLDRWSRVDVLQDAIDDIVGPTGVPGRFNCGPQGSGQCVDNDLFFGCDNGLPHAEEPVSCAASGQVCGLVARRTWGCVAAEQDLCAGYGTHVKPEGICVEGEKAVWCDPDFREAGAALRSRECDICDSATPTCGFSRRHGGMYCVAD